MLTGAWAHVYDVVGGAHHIGIVFHHDDGVAQPTQFLQNVDEPSGIPAVQTDGWLVQHVAGAYKTRAQRGRQLNALRLAARQCVRQAIQREIFQPHVVEEFQALADLDEDFFGDRGLFRGKFQALEKLLRFRDIHAHDIG